MKLNKTFSTLIITVCVFLLCSCQKLMNGACEFGYNHNSKSYFCSFEYSANDCTLGDFRTYHQYKSCNDLGYTSGKSSSNFTSPNGQNTPGAYGAYAGQGGGGGSSLPSYCSQGYQRPPGIGTQENSYCEGAYIHICHGGFSPSSNEVRSYCNIYNAFGNLPPCTPYCD